MEDSVDFKKYKWFITASGKKVVGGKSSIQNDELLSRLKSQKIDFIVMHTSSPGSPFSIILSDPKVVNEYDLEECAIFTACFSQSWKSKAKKVKIDIFRLSQIYKSKEMKSGTWGVLGNVDEKSVPLKLVLTVQDGFLRAVPFKTIKNKKDILLSVIPGDKEKTKLIQEISLALGGRFNKDQILSSLPAGGLKIIK